jgi:hypothetical protein
MEQPQRTNESFFQNDSGMDGSPKIIKTPAENDRDRVNPRMNAADPARRNMRRSALRGTSLIEMQQSNVKKPTPMQKAPAEIQNSMNNLNIPRKHQHQELNEDCQLSDDAMDQNFKTQEEVQ